jgi:hypothetical protein
MAGSMSPLLPWSARLEHACRYVWPGDRVADLLPRTNKPSDLFLEPFCSDPPPPHISLALLPLLQILDTVKLAEAEQPHSRDVLRVVFRVYESLGGHGTVTLRSAHPIIAASFTNLLEDPVEPLWPPESTGDSGSAASAAATAVAPAATNTLAFALRPFKVSAMCAPVCARCNLALV